jgi:MFS family permease
MRRRSALALPFFLSFGAFMSVFSLTVQQGLHQGALHSGLAITPLAVTFLIGSMLTPRLFARYGRRVLFVGGLVQALALGSLTAIVVERWPHVALPDLAPSLAVSGFAGSLIFVSLFRLVLADVPSTSPGSAAGRW